MRALIPLLIGLLWMLVAHSADAPWATSRADGLRAYGRGHDAEAAAHFRRAAGLGDARSAEMLALMYRFGPRLYPGGVPHDAPEAAKWAAVAADARRHEATATPAAR